MNRIILADEQAIFRAGAARVLALEEDMRIVAQCEDAVKLQSAVELHRGAVVVFSTGLAGNMELMIAELKAARSLGVAVMEKGESMPAEFSAQLGGVIGRSTTSAELVDTVRRVVRGQRGIQLVASKPAQAADAVGTRVRDRLTPKEMQIVALIVQGCKNKEIASTLGTKEQVIKNYLRSIYDKIGVSDRLELALFTLHHRVLNEAAIKVGALLQRTA